MFSLLVVTLVINKMSIITYLRERLRQRERDKERGECIAAYCASAILGLMMADNANPCTSHQAM